MKKTLAILSVVFLLSLTAIAQNNLQAGKHSWNIGVQLAATGNPSVYSGGMVGANALFSDAPYASGRFGIYARYQINDRLSIQSGFDFNRIGFDYALSQDYSLLKPQDHYLSLNTSTSLTHIPAILVYNSKLNCRNYRYIAGLGLAADFIDSKWETNSNSQLQNENVNNTAVTVLTAQAHTLNPSTVSITWLVGVEKVFKRGSMLDLTFQWNHGLSTVAQSTVTYSAENKYYTHSFTNRGSFLAVALTYYFKPIGFKKIGLPGNKSSVSQTK